MASVGWIDFSPSHRNRIGSVLDLLKKEGMVDELGLGTLRDSLANQLFPGISTIQTKAKYFFIVPYILYDYQKLKPAQRKSKNPYKYLEEKENEVMWQLADKYKHQLGTGVIGITKYKPEKIARRPSEIYWNGLNLYDFIDTRKLPINSFLKQAVNPSIESLLADEVKGDDAVNDDRDADFENLFRIKAIPAYDWSENLTLELTKDEAEFFRDRVISRSRDHLIAELLTNERLWRIFSQSSKFGDFAQAAIQVSIPENIRKLLILSHDFSEVMYGAHLAYNCQLQKKFFKNSRYEDVWKEWLKGIKRNMIDYQGYNPIDLAHNAAMSKIQTQAFALDWWNQVKHGFRDLKVRDKLIMHQEHSAKGSKARIYWNKDEDVKEKKWIGLKHFDYRFAQARDILTDIRTALSR